jgi:hypothetical protein
MVEEEEGPHYDRLHVTLIGHELGNGGKSHVLKLGRAAFR